MKPLNSIATQYIFAIGLFFKHNFRFFFNNLNFSAAAYCRQEQYDLAIQDCRTALALEPNYAKAYGRMGF